MLQLRDGQLRACIDSVRTWRDLVDSVTVNGSELEVLILKKELSEFCELVGTRYIIFHNFYLYYITTSEILAQLDARAEDD